jgi:dienelactone hydrolase
VQLLNHRLLADDYARNGFKVIVPDIFPDAAPENALDPGNVSFDFGAWLGRNGANVTEPVIRKVITALREQGVKRFGALGYCYGARLVFNLGFDNELDVLVVSHPSLLQIPADLERLVAESKAPLLINSCEIDSQLSVPLQKKADEVLDDGKYAPGYLRTYWDGCTHGFTVRGDMSDPKVKAGKEGAFKASVEWFIKHL